MGFARQFFAIWILVAMTLAIQSAGLAVLIHWARTYITRCIHLLTPWRTAVLMIRFTIAMVILHIVEILLWSAFYRWQCFLSWEPSFYFSAASYSTVGYGDVVLPHVWRTLGPLESVTGVLMSGISVSALFVILLQLVGEESGPATNPQAPQSLSKDDQPRDAVSVNDMG